MTGSRKLALGAVTALVLALTACGGHGTSTLPATDGDSQISASHLASSMHGQRPDVDRVANLHLILDTNGNATFALGNDDDGFFARTAIAAPIPAFTLACAHGREGRRHDDDEGCEFGRGDRGGRHAREGYYYVSERAAGDDDDDAPSAIVAGPGVRDEHGIAFPTANAPLTLSAHVRYRFELVRSNVPLATPTPLPTPTPSTIGYCRSYAGTVAGAAPTAPTPMPTAASPATGFITTFANAAVTTPAAAALACGPNGTIDEAGSGNGAGSLFAFSTANDAFSTLATIGVGQSILRLSPTEIALDAAGNIYVAGFAAATAGGKASNATIEIGTAGTVTPLTAVSHPYTLGIGSDGAAYAVTSDSLGTATYDIVRISNGAVGTPVAFPATCTSLNDNAAFAADTHGNLWFSDANCGIVSYAIAGGTFTTYPAAQTAAGASAIAVGPDGGVYVALADQLVRFDESTHAISTYALPGTTADAMIAGPAGDLYLAAHADDFSQYWLQRLNPSTGALVQYPLAVNGIGAFAAGSDGMIYAAANAESLVRIDPALAGH